MRKILITGGSRGIGRATAVACATRGWSLAINYREDAASAEAASADARAAGGQAITLRGDVARERDVVDLFGAAKDGMGGLDGVVVNAGVVAPKALLADMETARLRAIVEVNVLGAFLCAREAARHLMRDRGGSGGAIVLISSAASRLGAPGEFVDYAASKGAVDTLALGLARELAPHGVRVNAVRPGLIETDIHASGGQPDRAARLGKTTPIGRAGRPEEVAEAVVWLLSEAASYTTGAILDVTGGR